MGEFSLKADCSSRETCHVTSITELAGFNSSATVAYNVTIEATFLGITELDVWLGNTTWERNLTQKTKTQAFFPL